MSKLTNIHTVLIHVMSEEEAREVEHVLASASMREQQGVKLSFLDRLFGTHKSKVTDEALKQAADAYGVELF